MRLNVHAAPAPTDSDLTVIVTTSPYSPSGIIGCAPDVAAALGAEATRSRFDASLGAAALTHVDGRWYALVGVGDGAKAADFRRVGARALKLGTQTAATSLALVGATSSERAAFATEGLCLAGYKFDTYKSKPLGDDKPVLRSATVVTEATDAVARARDLAEAVCFARDLANEHPGRCTPSFLADQARDLADRHGMTAVIWGEDELARRGFNLLLAVGRGSDQESRFIHLTYRGEGPIQKTLCLVGKGVTYDSGGYSLKAQEHQVNMHLDMGGAAAVLGAAEAIGRTRPPGVEVHFLVPSVENLVSGRAYKLNEVIRSLTGTTVEILNTDAEGRLILADALAYANERDPDEIIDLATLTGACVVALGTETAGLFCNDEAMASRLLAAAERADESMWRLPLTPRMDDHLKSEVADIKNVGVRWGGAISAALFLKRFVGDTHWAHIDIAGPAMTDAEWEYVNKGGTGFGVLALHEYVTAAGRGA